MGLPYNAYIAIHQLRKYRQPIIKLWSVPVPVCETVPKFLLTDFTESYIDKGMLKEKAVLLFK